MRPVPAFTGRCIDIIIFVLFFIVENTEFHEARPRRAGFRANGSWLYLCKKNTMIVTIEVPATIPFEALKVALAPIKTLSVAHVQTDNLHLKVDLQTNYPHDFYEACNLLWLRFGPEMVQGID